MLYLIFTAAALGFDFDEVMMVCMGFAGLAYVIVDLKRERKLDQYAVEFAERLSRLEANSDDSIAIEGRIRALEIQAERDSRMEERIATYAERLAVVEDRTSTMWEGVEDDTEE